jgi:hypothetical protein
MRTERKVLRQLFVVCKLIIVFIFVCLFAMARLLYLLVLLIWRPIDTPLSCNLKSPLSMNFSLKYANLLIIQQHLILGNLNH